MGAKVVIGTPWMQNEGVLKKFGLRYVKMHNFHGNPADFRMGVSLQKYLYLSCYLS